MATSDCWGVAVDLAVVTLAVITVGACPMACKFPARGDL